MALFRFTDVDGFKDALNIAPKAIKPEVLNAISTLKEDDEMEEWILNILSDTNRTPHGPSEIVDILTHKVSVKGLSGMAGFILKGRSFSTVRPKDVSHQIFRLKRIQGLSFSFFIASGNVLDDVKEEFIEYSNSLNIDYCFLDRNDLARLFVAFGYICPRDGLIIQGRKCACGYSPKTKTSNILQLAALKSLSDTHEMEQKSGAVILPTGSGKTRVAVKDIRKCNPNRCIYIAHTHEILKGVEIEFLLEFPEKEILRIESKPKAAALRKINLVTIQTLSRNLKAFEFESIDYLVVDEFHHAAAISYRTVLSKLKPKFLLGLTATPFRGDQQDVLKICQNNVIVDYELRQGIEFGVLCPYHYFGCIDDVDYSRIAHNGRSYSIRDLEKALVIKERDEAIIAKWLEKAPGKPTIAFCCSHLHAERVSKSFSMAGIASESYLSTTEASIRDERIEKLCNGSIKVLCVVDILNEGIDLPYIECLMFLRPTESKRIFLQQLGRGLRHYPGKEFCTMIDFIGNFQNAYTIVEDLGLEPYDHGDPSLERANEKSIKEVLNLPLGCKVEFDDRVIEIFGQQTNNFAYATRRNIKRLLVYQYQRLSRRQGHPLSKVELNRTSIIGSRFYEMVFGSWKEFEIEIRDYLKP